eukprot:CAMPEP_0182418398 /NCGR_PEP_ID=MMETSP1167-20130531/2844_1 /TAXON_ID=2988 /ORGANISM="Mallomonas Sp, Strain CCMP3275" /LENGTH=119 /DNA_ID=CAMNT_0024592593 /DNA_START=130 /DNA_END=489 /DNA_ORIENTATION=-
MSTKNLTTVKDFSIFKGKSLDEILLMKMESLQLLEDLLSQREFNELMMLKRCFDKKTGEYIRGLNIDFSTPDSSYPFECVAAMISKYESRNSKEPKEKMWDTASIKAISPLFRRNLAEA